MNPTHTTNPFFFMINFNIILKPFAMSIQYSSSDKQETSKNQRKFFLVSCFAYFLTSKIVEVYSSEGWCLSARLNGFTCQEIVLLFSNLRDRTIKKIARILLCKPVPLSFHLFYLHWRKICTLLSQGTCYLITLPGPSYPAQQCTRSSDATDCLVHASGHCNLLTYFPGSF
jgi:hypothetical protein